MAEPFNTLLAAKQLQNAGCDQNVAEEVANQINGAISGTVATKSDIEHLQASTKADIELLRQDTKADIERLEASTKADIELLRKDIEISHSRIRTQLILWLSGVAAAMVALSKVYDAFF